MNPYITGAVMKELRQKNHLTQAELAQKLNVSDKTVSKWETGRGYPDITLLEPIAAAFRISVTELIAGTAIVNRNVSANMLRSVFYICPLCGNVIHSTGELTVCCHGIRLLPCLAEAPDEQHGISVEMVEDEYFVHIDHEMTKTHYISFIAALSSDGLQLIKLYPEGGACARVKCAGVRKIFCYCNKDGLFCTELRRGEKYQSR